MLVIAYSTVSVAGGLKTKPDRGGENKIPASSIENNPRKDPREEIRSFVDDENIEIGAIVPSDHQQISPSIRNNNYIPQHSIKQGMTSLRRNSVKRRTRRLVLRTICIPVVKRFCKKYAKGGITKRVCFKLIKLDCTSLDQMEVKFEIPDLWQNFYHAI